MPRIFSTQECISISKMNKWSKMFRLVLYSILLIVFHLHTCDTVHIALSVEPKNLGIVKVIEKAIEEHKISTIEVDHLQVLISNDSLTKNEIYKLLTANNSIPILLIDTTLKNGANSSFASNIKRLAREIGLPTLATGPTLGRPFKEIEQWKSLSIDEKKNLIEFSSTEEQIAVIVTDLTRHFSADPAILLYDNQFDLTEKYSYLFKNTRGKYLARRIDLENYSDVIEKVKKFEKGHFYVLASIEMSNELLRLLHADGLLTIQRNWYFITKNIGNLECEICNYGSITLIQPLRTRQVLYDHNCTMNKFTSKLSKLDAYFYYDLVRFVLHTLVEIKQTMVTDGLEDGLNVNFLAQSLVETESIKKRSYFNLRYQMSMEGFVGHYGRFVVHPIKNERNYPHYQEITMRLSKIEFWKPKEVEKIAFKSTSLITDTSRIDENIGDDETQKNFNLIKFGEWIYEPPSGLFVWTAALQQNKKTHYKIVTIVQPPFIMKRINGTAVEWYGYCLDLLQGMQKEMNDSWTFEMYEVPDGQYGIKDMTTNKWNGIIGQLSENLADIAVGPVSVMAEREGVVDFTVPYYDLVGVSILMKKSASRSHLFKFLAVLENEVWLNIFISYVVTSIILWLFDKLSPYSFGNNREKYKNSIEKRDFSLKECFWFCMTSITPQGGGEAPKNISGRMVVSIWWIFGFIVIACYTANLAAFLTVSRLDSPIESLNHLAEQYRIRYAAQVGTQALTYFERMAYIERKFYEIWKEITLQETNIVDVRERARMNVWDYPISDRYTNILKQMYISGLPKTFDEGVKRVKKSKSAQEGFAFLADATKIKYAAMINCELRQVGNEFSRKPLALAVPENSTLKDVLSSAILKLLNQRKLESLKEKWWNDNPDKKEDCDYDKKSNDGISINNIGGVFVVIFIGVVLAIITLIFEWIWKKIKGFNSQATVMNIQQFRQDEFSLPVNYNKNLISSMNMNYNHPINYSNPMSTIYEKAKARDLPKYN